MKKKAILPVMLLCCLLLAACGGEARTETVHLPAETPAPAAATPAPMPEADQCGLIERNRAVWQPDTAYETWFYTTSDLDHNGRLEVLIASLQGSGLYTYVACWEVNEGYTGLVPCPDNTREGEAWPDIIKDSVTSYRDPVSGRYTYFCEDLMRDGMTHYWTGLDSFSLDHGRIEVRTLASLDEQYSDQNTVSRHYYDENGAEVTEATYNSTEQRFFAGQEKETLTLNWTQLEQQPAPTPQPMITVQPQFNAQPQTVSTVTITKNPTSETIAAGGKTWFIAHADNAERLTWVLTGPDGQSYDISQAMAVNPGLQLQELPDDTLAVSNVPVSVNGWSVQARFSGPGGSVVTAPAMIYVQDSLSSYGPVLSAYYYAYTNGIIDPAYAYDRGISEYYTYSAHAGYALMDLNGDGVDELIIAGMGENDNSGGVVYEIDTLLNGQPVQLVCSSARNRYYLRTDRGVLNVGSGGAGYTVYTVSRLAGGAFVPEEAVMTYFQGTERDGYYHQLNDFADHPRDYDDYLTEEQFNYFVALWEQSTYIPALSPIA